MLHQIGNGALGPVFRAYDQERDRLVAVKLFRLDLPPERVHQLLSEFEKLIAAELQHPVIAAPRAAGIDGNSAYLAQDFAAADSLDVVIRENGAAPPAQAIRVAGQLAEALDYAADRQIVHGALHPRDILLSQEDIRIVGLGVARSLERVGASAPVRRPYAPPERIDDGKWDRSADVFSLAAITFELLCGKRVTGTGSEAAESLPEIPGADNEALQRVFALALAADPSYRYATASAFTDALKDAMGIEIAPAKPKAKRKPKLRVVALPLDEPQEVQEVQEVPGVPEVPEVEAEPEAVVEDLEAPQPVRKPRRRKAPAPTPVAIETVAQAPALSEVEGELTLAPEPMIEPESMIEPEEVADLPMEFAPVAEPEPEPVPSPELFAAPEPEPEPVLEIEPEPATPEPLALDPVPLALSPEPFESAEPVVPSPVFVAAPPQPSAVWPIGVAAVIGIALGFGAGYTVAIRDRAAAPSPAAVATPAALPQVAVQETTVAVTPRPASSQPIPSSPAAASTISAPPPVAPKLAAKPAAKADAPVFAGRVLIRSTPSGARLFVDGKDRGQTPATIRELSQGEHRIRLTRDGYTTAERRVVLSSKQPSQSISIPLKRDPQKPLASTKPNATRSTAVGTLVIESRPPGASVIIDGRHVGMTPMSLGDVSAGNHAVRLERDGYRIWTSGVSITASEQNRITASLEK